MEKNRKTNEGPDPSKDMQTTPPPFRSDCIFMKDAHWAEPNEKSILWFLFFGMRRIFPSLFLHLWKNKWPPKLGGLSEQFTKLNFPIRDEFVDTKHDNFLQNITAPLQIHPRFLHINQRIENGPRESIFSLLWIGSDYRRSLLYVILFYIWLLIGTSFASFTRINMFQAFFLRYTIVVYIDISIRNIS